MFDANGTEGLELFTWVVGFIMALVGALVLTHARTVSKEDNTKDGLKEAEEHHHDHTKTRV